MNCSKCNAEINKTDNYCNQCGAFVGMEDKQEYDFFENKTNLEVLNDTLLLDSIKKSVVKHKKIVLVVIAFLLIIITYFSHWNVSLKQAKNLYNINEYVKAKQKAERLLNPFNNREIEKIIYVGTIAEPYEKIKQIKNSEIVDEELYYSEILKNLLSGIDIVTEYEPVLESAGENFYAYYFLELTEYIDDVYKGDIHDLIDSNEQEQKIHIKSIVNNILMQKKLDKSKKELEKRLSKDGIKISCMTDYKDDEWNCHVYVKVDKKSHFSEYYKFRVSVTYYDENYNVIQDEGYELDSIYRGYNDTISITSVPKSKTKPFKYSVYVDYYEYDFDKYSKK
ncbi:MAG: zinc ribbon domain-containing protein [Ruminococcaceae bacterium]|nr:zinc ribbon domain-containing protein [Oscillospiraceae bacterium]